MDSHALSLYGQLDIELTDRLVLTLGGNYTRDRKTFATNSTSNDLFASLDLDAAQYAGFRRQLLIGGGLARYGVNPNDLGAVFAFATASKVRVSPATA